jgi:predicted HD superfamily hydrolase involved in NAD metabolism
MSNIELIEKLKDECFKQLSTKRYEHVVRVARMVEKLSTIYQFNLADTLVAVYLHDLYKELSIAEQREIVKKYYPIYIHENSEIFHGKVAGYFAREKYKITNQNIIDAVEYHTTGRENMAMETKILLIADYIEEGRDFPGLNEIRELVYNNQIDQGIVKMYEKTFNFLETRGLMIARDSLLGYKYLKHKTTKSS